MKRVVAAAIALAALVMVVGLLLSDDPQRDEGSSKVPTSEGQAPAGEELGGGPAERAKGEGSEVPKSDAPPGAPAPGGPVVGATAAERPNDAESTPAEDTDAAHPEVPRARPGNVLVVGDPEPGRLYVGSLEIVGFSEEVRVETDGDGFAKVWGVKPGAGVVDFGTTKLEFDVVSEAPPIEDAEALPTPDGGLLNLFVGDQVPFSIRPGSRKVAYACSEGSEFVQLEPDLLGEEMSIVLRATAPGRAVCRIAGVDVVAMIRAE
jgi:hypothetical protein